MSSNTTWTRPFGIPGPWLSVYTQQTLDLEKDARRLVTAFGSQHLPLEKARLFTGAINKSNTTLFIQLTDPAGTGKPDGGIASSMKAFLTGQHPRSKLRPDLLKALPERHLPHLLYDCLLHAIDDSPPKLPPLIKRAATRPGNNASVSSHFAHLSDTIKMLEGGATSCMRHEQNRVATAHLDAVGGPRSEYLHALRQGDVGAHAGNRAIACVEACASVFQYMLLGDLSFSPDSWHQLFFQDATHRGLEITLTDLVEHIPQPNTSLYLAAAYVAVAHSCLALVYDVANYRSTTYCTP
ncbi:hypothetical protein B0H19DRAFT_1243796, partial [Mycena capillaripes]